MSDLEIKVRIGEVVLVAATKFSGEQYGAVGIVKYIGMMYGDRSRRNYLGVELVEPVPGGHNGTVQGIFYYHAQPMHGLFIEPSQIIKKLTPAEVMAKYMKSMVSLSTQALRDAETIDEQRKKIEVLTLDNNTLRTQLSYYYNMDYYKSRDALSPVPVPSIATPLPAIEVSASAGKSQPPVQSVTDLTKKLRISTMCDDDIMGIGPLSPFPEDYKTPANVTPFDNGNISFDLPQMLSPTNATGKPKNPSFTLPRKQSGASVSTTVDEEDIEEFVSMSDDYPRMEETPPLPLDQGSAF